MMTGAVLSQRGNRESLLEPGTGYNNQRGNRKPAGTGDWIGHSKPASPDLLPPTSLHLLKTRQFPITTPAAGEQALKM